MKEGGRRGIRLIVVLLSATVLGLMAAEAIVRLFSFQPIGREMVPNEYRLSAVPGLIYELTPDHDYRWRYGPRHWFDDGFTVPVSINSLGLRDREFDRRKPSGERRILVLGDSVTMGMGVGADQCYVEVLERKMNTGSSESGRIEVINAGVGGYNVRQELAFLRHRGLSFNPDLIILGFHVNDVGMESSMRIDEHGMLRVDRRQRPPRFNPDGRLRDPARERDPLQWLVEESHLIRWLAGRRLREQPRKLSIAPGPKRRLPAARAVIEIAELAHQAELPLLMLIFRPLEEVGPEHEHLRNRRWFAELACWLGVPYLTMDHALKDIEMSELWVHPADHHPNVRCHRLYADWIVEHLGLDDGTFSTAVPRRPCEEPPAGLRLNEDEPTGEPRNVGENQ